LPSERVERRLTAILAADVAGYSRLTGMDEEGTHAQLKEHLGVLVDPKIVEHRGRVVKNTGDGVLAVFDSVVDAVRCALDIQRGMAERNAEVPQEMRIEFRIGINVGDIIIDRGDIFGDGVNVAVRLEGIAEPGGICVSSRVQEDANGKLDVAFEDIGERQLKNIGRPVRVYRVLLDHRPTWTRPTLALPEKPSIAVLAFENLSGDAEQEYFADGIVEDIITALSRFKNLFVIAHNSSFTYKRRPTNVQQVGRELGVRYVLEGSVRKAGNRVRVSGRLIDSSTGAHLWADRFEGASEDIFDLQDQVTTSVVSAITPSIENAEIERAKRKPTANLDAYDYYLRGLAIVDQMTKEANDEALRLFNKAIELDPDFARAYARASYCYMFRKMNRWMADPQQEVAEAARLARLAAEAGKGDAVTLSIAGYVLAYMVGDFDCGAALVDRALVLNPNLAGAWGASGWVKGHLGEHDTAIEHAAIAIRLSPLDPRVWAWQACTARALFFSRRYDKAAMWAERALREQPNHRDIVLLAAASNGLAGRLEQAQKAIARLRQLDPALRLSSFRQRDDHVIFVEGLRIAGLPE
jgi:TolB-like protein/class 3 adenylate cyclase